MPNLASTEIWDVISGILALHPDTFEHLQTLPGLFLIALLVVFLAGLSQMVAQSIVLFANQVSPLRFGLSLLTGALLFAAGYLFWAFSIWLGGIWFLDVKLPLLRVITILGLSYGPLLFSFLGALPYLGVPILRGLAVWNLLAIAVGFSTFADLRPGQALWYVGFGWLVLQVLQQTIGQPIANLGQWLANRAAGVQLVADRQALKRRVMQGRGKLPPWRLRGGGTAAGQQLASATTWDLAAIAPNFVTEANTSAATLSLSVQDMVHWGRPLKRLLQFAALALMALLISVVLSPLREWLIGLDADASRTAKVIADLVWIGILALIVGGLLAPLEALGWWAGWYGDPVQTVPSRPDFSAIAPRPYDRYVVYIDGIGQTTKTYQPAVAYFLQQLEARIPDNICLIKGLMSYSVLNRDLTEERLLSTFWRLVDRLQDGPFMGWIGNLINLRNLLIVTVSADQRYGPIYNQGMAQRIYDSLIQAGYPLSGGVPLTLIGYSGGSQIAMGTVPFLKRALGAPVEVISLGGVISGHVHALETEQLYHLVGTRDRLEKLGSIMFPRRWPIFHLSYWNRAKRKHKISFISLGKIGHQVPGGIMDPHRRLPDGRTHLQQTLDLILNILDGDIRQVLEVERLSVQQPGNYYRFRTVAFNCPDVLPVPPAPAPPYRPMAPWTGRLKLPASSQRRQVRGVWFEIHRAPAAQASWIGKTVRLRWASDPEVQAWVQAVTQDVHFSAEAEFTHRQGLIHPTRLNHWRTVDPLESLAGARPVDDMVVMLSGPVDMVLDADRVIALTIREEPIQISGSDYALVQFLEPVDDACEQFRVAHFNPEIRDFSGPREVVRLPTGVPDINDTWPAVNRGLETSPPNGQGWYIYGNPDGNGQFVVRSLVPRQLLRLSPERWISDSQAGRRYIKRESWSNLAARKGCTESVLISSGAPSRAAALERWQRGDRALLVHVYGAIGGNKREPEAQGPIYFGHFAYGVATVVREPVADELQFEIVYHQVYTHNRRGLIAGRLHWSRYMGDRQWGFLGTRPVSDILIRLPAYTDAYDFDGYARSPLDDLQIQLQIMTARYRIGDGTGGTYIGPANNCAQDSNQALYASIKQLEDAVTPVWAGFQDWAADHPDQAQRFQRLLRLRRALQRELLPFGSARADWAESHHSLGSNLQDYPLKTLGRGLVSWRTMLPRVASDTVVSQFLKQGADLWVLRTNQVGGNDPDIEPLPPVNF